MATRRTAGAVGQTVEHVAHHEAGHFVAAYFQGMPQPIHIVTIVPAGNALGHNESEDPVAADCSEREVERVIIGLFAGHAAELRFDPSREIGARSTARDDDAKADEHLRWLRKTKSQRQELERRLRSEARSLVEAHWGAVTALASELLQRRTLDAYEASWFVAVGEGEQAKRDLADYRRKASQQGKGSKRP